MESKHTPGPWKVAPSPYGHFLYTLLNDCKKGYTETGAEKANARLMSAAPDLLETLVKIVEETEKDVFSLHDKWVIRIATNAIKKATESEVVK